MRIRLTLHAKGDYLDVPVNYNHMLQAAVYQNLSPEFARFLHDQGFCVGGRKFALFVFSRLIGKYEYLSEQKRLRFASPVEWLFASPVAQFIQEISNVFIKGGIKIGHQNLKVTGFEVMSNKVDGNSVCVRTLSPVVAYSTMLRSDGRKYTAYFHPKEKDFQRIVVENLRRKGKLLFGEKTDFSSISVHPVSDFQKNIVVYKGTVIEAYSGKFLLQGDNRLLQVALDAGLGSKNSMGFGMVEAVPF
ncbi:CRISPR-associated endoribonuclease Cas6 [Bacillaceae bacterium]